MLACAWLLLLPNASYLITELNQSHRRENDTVPLWFDIILVITLAMSGVVNTIVNLFVAHTIAALVLQGDDPANYLQPRVLAVLAAALILIPFGMYLGRYPRFNSWDVRHPVSFVRKLREHFSTREHRLAALGFTLTYAIFLALLYVIIVGPIIELGFLVEELRFGG